MRPLRTMLGWVAVPAVLSLAAVVPAQAATGAGWRVVFTHHYGPATNFSAYTAVVAPAARDAWVFGTTSEAGLPAPGTPVAEHWTGGAWHGSSLPPGQKSEIIAASAPAPADVWAITEVGGILHWNGSHWSVARQLRGDGLLSGVTALSAHDVWVFGPDLGAGPGLGSSHFDGHSWAPLTGNASRVVSATPVSARDIWATAMGANTVATGAIMHYNGSSWRQITAPALSGLRFGGIVPLSSANVWATAVDSHDQPRLVHLSGGRWTSMAAPWSATLILGSIAPDGRGGLWFDPSNAAGTHTWAWHRSASGHWTRTALAPGEMGQMALIPGTTSLWGTGALRTTTTSDAQIWAFGKTG